MMPVELQQAVAGIPQIGEWEPMLPLLTLGKDGFPHVCLLSRAELDVRGDHLIAAIASSTTIANLRRSGKATLIVVGADAAVYAKLDLDSTIANGGLHGVTFRLQAAKRDGLGVPLEPMRYLAAEHISAEENWDASARLLADLNLSATEGTSS